MFNSSHTEVSCEMDPDKGHTYICSIRNAWKEPLFASMLWMTPLKSTAPLNVAGGILQLRRQMGHRPPGGGTPAASGTYPWLTDAQHGRIPFLRDIICTYSTEWPSHFEPIPGVSYILSLPNLFGKLQFHIWHLYYYLLSTYYTVVTMYSTDSIFTEYLLRARHSPRS